MRTRIKIATLSLLIVGFSFAVETSNKIIYVEDIREDVIDISYFITTYILHSSIILFSAEIVERVPPFIDNEMRVLYEIGNHKRRKKFFIHRICRAQLYFAWFVEGNALLESCHAMETLLKTSFNICLYIYIKNMSRRRVTAAIIPFIFLAWQAKFRGSSAEIRALQVRVT